MKKYRINKGISGFNVFLMVDMGNGWSKEFLSNHETKEQASLTVEKLKAVEEQNILCERGCLNYE